MAMYATRLQARHRIAEGTLAFHFDRPAGFTFKAGQAVDIVLGADAASGAPDARHAFSIVSAPWQNELVVATRMRDSAFKRALQALPLGAPAMLDGPFGSLTLHKDPARAGVLIAGGIGITPFVSILRQAARDQAPQDLLLLYANHRPEDAAFLPELEQLEAQNKRFHLIATMTRMERSTQPWSGRVGRIDGGFVRLVAGHYPAPIFYLAGPPDMVEAMQHTLVEAGFDEDNIRSEAFHGY